MPRIVNTHEHASALLDGIPFKRDASTGHMISEPVDHTTARRFASIPGFELAEGDLPDGPDTPDAMVKAKEFLASVKEAADLLTKERLKDIEASVDARVAAKVEEQLAARKQELEAEFEARVAAEVMKRLADANPAGSGNAQQVQPRRGPGRPPNQPPAGGSGDMPPAETA